MAHVFSGEADTSQQAPGMMTLDMTLAKSLGMWILDTNALHVDAANRKRGGVSAVDAIGPH